MRRSGSSIHYWLTGPQDGPLVTFTPGATMDHRMFDEQVRAVVTEGYRALTWDVRGHGLSKPIGEKFTLGAVAGDLLAILDALGYAEAVSVGQSFGGFVAQEVAFRHPERVRALVLIGSARITSVPKKRELWALKLTPLIFRLWPKKSLRKVTARNTAVEPEVQRYALEATSLLSKREFLTVWRAVVDSIREVPGHRIEQPLLLTHGEHDRAGNVARTAPQWAAEEPDCRYEIIPGAGHNANQDAPQAFNDHLVSFLRESVPTR